MSMPSTNEQPARRYLRAPRAIAFPTEAEVPETRQHLDLRTALYTILRLAFRNQATIGSEQFVYWDPTDPRECLAPVVVAPDDASEVRLRLAHDKAGKDLLPTLEETVEIARAERDAALEKVRVLEVELAKRR